MKVFVIQLLGIIFVTLIISSIQSATADHLEPGNGLFKNMETVELTKTDDTNYRVYLQTVLRNGDGQLISVTEGGIRGYVVPHKVTDHIFDTLMGKKEIVTIDNIKYEKVQYVDSPSRDYDEVDYFLISALMLCGEIYGHDPKCMSVFQASTAAILVTQTDVVTNHWTILRVMN